MKFYVSRIAFRLQSVHRTDVTVVMVTSDSRLFLIRMQVTAMNSLKMHTLHRYFASDISTLKSRYVGYIDIRVRY
jgi:hypothetical protein